MIGWCKIWYIANSLLSRIRSRYNTVNIFQPIACKGGRPMAWLSIMTSSNGNFLCVTGPLCGEFTGHRWIPLIKANDADFFFLICVLNKRLSKQSWGWWFEPPLLSLWRNCNVWDYFLLLQLSLCMSHRCIEPDCVGWIVTIIHSKMLGTIAPRPQMLPENSTNVSSSVDAYQ